MTGLIKKFSTSLVLVSLVSCSESDDANKVAQAQDCLNDITSATATTAGQCLSYISGVNTTDAQVIRCSVAFMEGELTTERITNAYVELTETNSTDKEAVFISTLGLSSIAAAEAALEECILTGNSSLIYIAALSQIGTVLLSLTGQLGGVGVDFIANPSLIEAQIDACAADASSCNVEAIGASAQLISSTYCASRSADQDVCEEFNAAVGSSDTPAGIGQALFEFLNDAS